MRWLELVLFNALRFQIAINIMTFKCDNFSTCFHCSLLRFHDMYVFYQIPGPLRGGPLWYRARIVWGARDFNNATCKTIDIQV